MGPRTLALKLIMQSIKKSLSFAQKKIKICNAMLHNGRFIVLKKVLIIASLTALFLFFGWQYSLESTRKHEEFLLTQSLFPEISEYVQKNQIRVQPIKIELKNKSFVLYIDSQHQSDALMIQPFITEWLKSNLKFHDYQFRVEQIQQKAGEK